mgnify:CR=1 FL=1
MAISHSFFPALLENPVGFYELIDIKTLVGVFITPAFIISASLRYKSKKEKTVDSI